MSSTKRKHHRLRPFFPFRKEGKSRNDRSHPLPDGPRNLFVIIAGEFCGTFMFLLLSYIGTQTALNTNDPGDTNAPLLPFSLLYIAVSFGTALTINVWVWYRVTGGLFNPAVTLGLLLVGAVTPVRALFIVPTQVAASILAAFVTSGLLPGPLLVANELQHGTNIPQGIFIEMFLTAQLVLTVYFLAVEKLRATFLAPIGIGISVFIAHICGTNYTGTSLNPARSVGPAVVSGFSSTHYVFWVGPLLGALLAFAVYRLFKWLEYQTANPGQDDDDLERAISSVAEEKDERFNQVDIRDAPGTFPPKQSDSPRRDSVMDGPSSSAER